MERLFRRIGTLKGNFHTALIMIAWLLFGREKARTLWERWHYGDTRL